LLPAGLVVDRVMAGCEWWVSGCIIRDTTSRRRRVPVLRALVLPIQNFFCPVYFGEYIKRNSSSSRAEQKWDGKTKSNFSL